MILEGHILTNFAPKNLMEIYMFNNIYLMFNGYLMFNNIICEVHNSAAIRFVRKHYILSFFNIDDAHTSSCQKPAANLINGFGQYLFIYLINHSFNISNYFKSVGPLARYEARVKTGQMRRD